MKFGMLANLQIHWELYFTVFIYEFPIAFEGSFIKIASICFHTFFHFFQFNLFHESLPTYKFIENYILQFSSMNFHCLLGLFFIEIASICFFYIFSLLSISIYLFHESKCLSNFLESFYMHDYNELFKYTFISFSVFYLPTQSFGPLQYSIWISLI